MDTVMAITTSAKQRAVYAKPGAHRTALWRKFAVYSGILLAVTLPAAALAQSPQTIGTVGTSNPGIGFNESTSNVLEPGDLVTVNVFNTPELSGSLRVDPAGKLLLPVGGQLPVTGLTAAEAAKAIENLLRANQIMIDPHVSVLVTQFATQGVTILGEVRNPGIYPVRGASTLYDALSMAGGPTITEGADIKIAHRGDTDHVTTVQVDSANYSPEQQTTPIAPGDTVVVSRAPSVWVVGDVITPGQYPLPYGKPLSVLNIMALTHGINPTAATKRASIVRTAKDGAVETIPVDIDKIMRNQAPNVVLEASDVLVVPRSGLKAFMQFALPSLTNAAVSGGITAAIYR